METKIGPDGLRAHLTEQFHGILDADQIGRGEASRAARVVLGLLREHRSAVLEFLGGEHANLYGAQRLSTGAAWIYARSERDVPDAVAGEVWLFPENANP